MQNENDKKKLGTPNTQSGNAEQPENQQPQREQGQEGQNGQPGIQMPEVPSIELPKGGGAISGMGEKFQANPVTGTGSFSIPIAMSPGRGLTPQLGLAYNSGSGNSAYGLGWSVGLPSITRKTDKGLPTYQDASEMDTFILSGAEDLVPKLDEVTPGNWERDTRDETTHTVFRYRPRTEGLFARIERWLEKSTGISHWRATTPDNVTTIYGESTDTRIADPNDSTKVFQWLIERTFDSMGNIVLYSYKQEDDTGVDKTLLHEKNRLKNGPNFPHRYLKTVKYGNTSMYTGPSGTLPTDWHFQLVFDYGEHHSTAPTTATPNDWTVRQDPFSAYRAGFEIRQYRLCKRVLMFHKFVGELGSDFVLVKATELTHDANAIATTLSSVTHRCYDGSTNEALPSLDMTYSTATQDTTLYHFDAEDLENLPGGADGQRYLWQDLDGEGISGILTEEPGGWYYKRNLGDESYYYDYAVSNPPAPDIRFGALETVASKPNVGSITQLADIDGDGQTELVIREGMQGFFERSEAGSWETLQTFSFIPNINWQDPNLRMIDLTGDGRADLLITEDQCFRWYPSLAKEGYDESKVTARHWDEEQGPALVFADGTQSIYLSDMSGDGLTDICRVRNGEVSYWPNMGYGKFGTKVGMDNAPRFDYPEIFDHSRIRLTDVDGSGTTDLIYLGTEKVSYWNNNSGNSFSLEKEILNFPTTNNITTVQAIDLFGKGTSCLVWSSPLPGDHPHRIRYIDLMGQKPYLLTEVNNNMGAASKMHYAPSTKFYLRDKQEGNPWITKLPFPVQVVERTEVYDEITGQRYVSRYAYHHGYYDRHEREFRGFGMVEQWDTEQYVFFSQAGLFQVGTNALDEESHIPPIHTKTWFHNGYYENRKHIAEHFRSEYYQGDTQGLDWALPDTVVPSGLSPEEEREACRALRGQALHSEVYADDNTSDSDKPYTVSENSFTIKLIQPESRSPEALEGRRAPAVFQIIPDESLSFQYERNTDDPRVSHSMTLKTDPDYGMVTHSASIAYRRRGTLPLTHDEQEKMWISYSVSDIFHVDGDSDAFYRLGVPKSVKSYEVHNITDPGTNRLAKSTLTSELIDTTPTEIGYDEAPGSGVKIRLLGHQTVTYYNDDADTELTAGQVGKHGLPYQSKSLVYTGDMITNAYNVGTTRVTDTIMQNEGEYEKIGTDWWAPSPTANFDKNNFYVLTSSTDPFGSTTTITYDSFKLFPTSSEDELGNTVSADIDYRVLSVWETTDINENRQQVEFDTLGMVTKMAVMGKTTESLGDTLSDPTRKLTYDLFNWKDNSKPNFVKTEAREEHGGTPTWQTAYAYSNGLGQVVLQKVQAEPGDAFKRDINGDLELDINGDPILEHTASRWIGNGRTIVNNKGLAVKQYEPYFSSTHEYEDETEVREYGVTPILTYDSLGRNIRTDMPDGTFTKVEFDCWQQKTYDQNDTVQDSTWYSDRNSPDPDDPEPTDPDERAAWLAAAHYNTPKLVHLDSMGRVFLTQDDLGEDGTPDYVDVRIEMDIEGKRLTVTNDLGQDTVFTYGMRPMDREGNAEILYTDSPDGGWRRSLISVSGNPIRAWNERGFDFRNEYDALQRPTHAWVDEGSGELLHSFMVYGDNINLTAPEDDNERGQVIRAYDQSGAVKPDNIDFKGNITKTITKLAKTYKSTVDWSALDGLTSLSSIDSTSVSSLESDTFTALVTFDALNRPTLITQPDGSKHKPTYNEANLLEKMEVELQHESGYTTYVSDIDYNEKGQRTDIYYGNGSKTTYTYDANSYRLTRLLTTRDSGTDILQDLNYTYDSIGNITELEDDAQQTHYFSNTVIDPKGKYVYDPLYRLTQATGREKNTTAPSEAFFSPSSVATNGKSPSEFSTYCEKFTYDTLGNMLSLSHKDTCGGTENWKRTYVYNSGTPNNYCQSAYTGSTPPSQAQFTYDAHGNMLKMPHITTMAWDFADQLRSTAKTDETTYYVYSGGQRTRKVCVDTSGSPDKIKYERIYLGGYEIYREYDSSEVLDKQRDTHKVMDDQRMIALLEVKTVDGGSSIANGSRTTITRYQYTNHLDSASLELDENADVISYEEYYPFGSTSYQLHTNDSEVSLKRYKYVHKERDEETGLYYYGARYYAPWLCRFVSVDPLKDNYPQLSTFQYAGNKPINFVDIDGMESEGDTTLQEEIQVSYKIIGGDQINMWETDYVDPTHQTGGTDYSSLTAGGIIPHEWWTSPDGSVSPAVAGFVDELYRTLGDMAGLVESGFHHAVTIGAVLRGPGGYQKSMAWQLSGDKVMANVEAFEMLKEIASDPEKMKLMMDQLVEMFGDTLAAAEGESIKDAYARGAMAFEILTMFVGVGEVKALMKGGKISSEIVEQVAKKVDIDLADAAKLRKVDGVGGLGSRTIIIDENLSPSLGHMLEKQGFTVKRFAEKEQDVIIGEWAKENGAFILSNNKKDFMRASGFRGAQAIYVPPSLTSRSGRVDILRRMINIDNAAKLNPELLNSQKINLLDY